MKIPFPQALIAGLIGTLLFDITGFALTGNWWDIAGLLSTKFGTGLLPGVLGHYANGAMLAIIYSAIAPSLPGPKWFRAMSFITVQTVIGVWLFMLPLLDMGIAGLGVSPMIPVITMLRHWAYGVALIQFVSITAPGDNSAKSALLHDQPAPVGGEA